MIICVRDGGGTFFLEWSSIVDAPVSRAMSRDRMLARLIRENGTRDEAGHRRRLDRAEATGTSARDGQTVEDAVRFNRAGPEETCLTYEAIIRRYVRGEKPTYHKNAMPCIDAVRRWGHGDENHDEDGDGPVVNIAVDPFDPQGIRVVVTPNLRDSRQLRSFVIGATDTPESVVEQLRVAKSALEETDG